MFFSHVVKFGSNAGGSLHKIGATPFRSVRVCLLAMDESEMRITDAMEEILRKYDDRVTEQLDAWLLKLDEKLGLVEGNMGNAMGNAPHHYPTAATADFDAENSSGVSSEVFLSQSPATHDRQCSATSALSVTAQAPPPVRRTETPDSYENATKVGQSIAAAFLKLGSHSQEVYLGVQLEWTATHRDDKSLTQTFAMIHLVPVLRRNGGVVVEQGGGTSFWKSE
eukprot:Skav200382  [mRNA]  locus=scaffold2518:408064:410679:- [translate_table: standard]